MHASQEPIYRYILTLISPLAEQNIRMDSRHSFYLLLFIVVGVFVGLLVGWYWGAAATNVAWLGQFFLNLLSMLVIPLLVSAVISGVTSIGDVRQLGRLSGATIAYYLITVAIAVLIGLLIFNRALACQLKDCSGRKISSDLPRNRVLATSCYQ